MEDVFLSSLAIEKIRNIENFNIPISLIKRTHLIITGKNGSGKTTLLTQLRNSLSQKATSTEVEKSRYQSELRKLQKEWDSLKLIKSSRVGQIEGDIKRLEILINTYGGLELDFVGNDDLKKSYSVGKFLIAFFDAKRITNLKTPTGITKISLKHRYNINEQASTDFIQYIVNLKADKSFARDEGDETSVIRIDRWFDNFQKSLQLLFNTDKLELKFDRKNYNFTIIEDNKEPYSLNQLSDGFSAILNIVTELIMRMEKHNVEIYDLQGIVLIDEIETHLHVELQKKILPFLTSFFPRIQFIVTTHSPFIISSIENTVICDLEKKVVTENLSGYSYDTLLESYFEVDKYSMELTKKIERFESLTNINNLSESEITELYELKTYLAEIPKFISDELAVKLQQIKLKELAKK